MKKFRSGRSFRRRVWLAVLLILLLAAVCIWFVVFHLNQFTLAIVREGEPEITLEYGDTYCDPGARAVLYGTLFLKNGIDPRVSVQTEENVNDGRLGKHAVVYRAEFHRLQAESERIVRVADTQCPVITLTPDDPEDLLPGQEYREKGYSAWDNYDGDITSKVVREETEGLVTYSVLDSSGNPAYAERVIPIVDKTPPVITLLGGEEYRFRVGKCFEDPGYTAADDIDGDLTDTVEVSGDVDWLTPGTYPVIYTVRDAMGNEASLTRNFIVQGCSPEPTVTPDGEVVYLTFDDGPGPYTAKLLDILQEYGVKATFFVVGNENPDLLRRIVNEGHTIAIHTTTHEYGTIYADPESYFQDLYAMQDAIRDATGVETWLMRFPGGSSNTVSRRFCKGIMSTLTKAVQDAGFRYFDWNVDSDDAGQAHTSQKVKENVIDGLQSHRVSIVLQHDIHSCSVDAVEDILIWGQENGYRFLPLEGNSPTAHHGVNN